jgi:phosphate starvation-inducible protein PhoH
MARKSKTKKDENVEFLSTQISNGNYAIKELKDKRAISLHDIKTIKAITTPQQIMFESYFEGNNIIANGSAGTGKTFSAIYLALCDLLDNNQPQKKIIIVRSIVPSREIGYLPGDKDEKMEPYEAPYKDIFAEICQRYTAYDVLKEQNKVVFMPTSFLRGLTWENCVVIIDEVQNMNFHEINTVITRIGNNCNLIVVGDMIQTDLYKNKYDQCGMDRFLRVARKMDSFTEVVFTQRDIVRSSFVKDWIIALEETN